MVLDHLIATVPDLPAVHKRLLAAGFDEAWPPGPFWPAATTSGIALGGVNLELVGPDSGVDTPTIETLVLAPDSHEEGIGMVKPLGYREAEKVEPNADLLALRGFPPERRGEPQTICRNLYPVEGATPYPFFLCLYAPFLKARLAASNFAQPRGPVLGLSLVSPEPQAVHRLFAGRLGSIALDVRSGDRSQVTLIHFGDGSALTALDL